MNNSLLESGSTMPTTIECRQVAVSPVLKSFQKIQKVLALKG
jgi:hypothetical protein